jgi:hypothetical protein
VRDITIARHLLPEADQEREEILKKYFCELGASAVANGDHWNIKLFRPTDAEFYVDPDIAEGLQWWSRRFEQVDLSDIPFALTQLPGWQLSLNDSWTLYSWSQWFQQTGGLDGPPKCVTVLHLDDHDDLMTPRVAVGPQSGFRDLISAAEIDLRNASTVAAAVTSGAIGIGSFMAPLLHAFPNVHVRHLCSTEYSDARKGPHAVTAVQVFDDLLSPGSVRPALRLSKFDDVTATHLSAISHPYIVTDDLGSWLEDLPPGPVLLHIDMDYFNNRFNGDSDWVDEGPKYDPPLSQVLDRIDGVFASLESSGIVQRVEDFAVALSPGFFPVDLWEPTIDRISLHVERLVAVGYWQKRK